MLILTKNAGTISCKDLHGFEKGTAKMFSIPGFIPVTIQPMFWIMTIILGWPQNIHELIYLPTWIAVVTVSVLIHEYGHALTAKFFGHTVHIELHGMGGMAQHDGPQLSSLKRFFIILNGPLAGFCLYWASSFILYNYGNSLAHPIIEMLYMSMWINLYWTLLNLIPVYPMDGGQLMRIVLVKLFGNQGVKLSILLSIVLGACLSIYFLTDQRIYMAALFLLFTVESYKSWNSAPHVSKFDQKDELQDVIHSVFNEMRYGNQESAKMKLMNIREKSKKGTHFQTATQYLAELLIQQGQSDGAYELLHPIEKSLNIKALMLLHELTYCRGNLTKSIELGNRVFQQTPDYNTALLNAYAHARLDNVRPAIGWLSSAVREGLHDLQSVLQRDEFDRVRIDPLFQKTFSLV